MINYFITINDRQLQNSGRSTDFPIDLIRFGLLRLLFTLLLSMLNLSIALVYYSDTLNSILDR